MSEHMFVSVPVSVPVPESVLSVELVSVHVCVDVGVGVNICAVDSPFLLTCGGRYDHGLISPAVFSSLKTECKNMDSEANPSPACAAVQSVAEKQIG